MLRRSASYGWWLVQCFGVGILFTIKSIPWLLKKLVSAPIGVKVYHLLWFFSIVFTAYGTAFYLVEGNGFHHTGVRLIVPILFGVLTLIQLVLIYIDIHKIDHSEPDALAEYGSWVGSFVERIIRLLIIITLLLIAGKVVSLIYPFLSCEGIRGERGNLCEVLLPDGKQNYQLFAIGSALVFFLILVWNIAPGMSSIKTWRKLKLDQNPSATERGKLTVRIWLFALSALACVFFWVQVFLDNEEIIVDFSMIFLLLYVIAISVALYTKYDEVCQFCRSVWHGEGTDSSTVARMNGSDPVADA